MGMASKPTRGTKVTLTVGLMTIPVTFYNAIDGNVTGVKRAQYSPAGHKIRYRKVDEVTQDEVAGSEIVMKFDTGENLVELSDEEIASAMGHSNGDSELLGIYPMKESKKYLPSNHYQVRPQSVKVGSKTTHPYDKAFALFMRALQDTKSFALVTWTSSGTVKYAGLFGDASAVGYHWADEVREVLPVQPVEEVGATGQELDMAVKLVEVFRQESSPEPLENTAQQSVVAYAMTKAAGGEAKAEAPVETPVVASDMLAMLEASIAAAKGGKVSA